MSLLLKNHIQEIITDLSDEDFDYILSHFVLIKRQKHQFVLQAGDEVKYSYWVVKGCVRSYVTDDAGKEAGRRLVRLAGAEKNTFFSLVWRTGG